MLVDLIERVSHVVPLMIAMHDAGAREVVDTFVATFKVEKS